MHLRLIIPHLFDFAEQLPLPPELRRLRRGERQQHAGSWIEAWLCQLCGLDQQPVAALTAMADGLGPGSWLRADPVHLQLGQNAVSVQTGEALQLHEQEAQQLADCLRPLLHEDGLELHLGSAERWYLRVPADLQAQFLPLPAAIGQPLPAQTIHGAQAGAWKRRVAELQMSLHQHPVNEEREQRGLPPINGLWLWGEGQLPRTLPAPAAQLWGDHPLLSALAQTTSRPLQPLPLSFDLWHQRADEGAHLLLLDSLLAPALAGDGWAFAEQRQQLLQDWLMPALKAGVQELLIDIPALHSSCSYRLQRWSRWQLWKKTHVGY